MRRLYSFTQSYSSLPVLLVGALWHASLCAALCRCALRLLLALRCCVLSAEVRSGCELRAVGRCVHVLLLLLLLLVLLLLRVAGVVQSAAGVCAE